MSAPAGSVAVPGAGDFIGAAIVRRFALCGQPGSAWTFEQEIRPCGEKW